MDKIEELLTRGVEQIYPSKEELERVLRSGKKLKLYQGFDPTGPDMHIGHMVGLMKLKQWQDLGHHVIFLIGDFTAMVGDPTGKYSARKTLTHEQTLENAQFYKNQASMILDFEGDNPAEGLYNGDWLGKISAVELLRIVSFLSYQQVVERDMFQERLKQGQDVYMSEFLYPVMQAYDSVVMDVDLEVGGNDQMFNMLMGRKLMRNMKKKDKFVMTTPLLTDSQGRKIGKTEGNAITLNDPPEELYGKIMRLPDEVIGKCFECLTNVPMPEVREIQEVLKKDGQQMELKKRLAYDLVEQLYNSQEAHFAQEHFEKTIQKKELPSDIPIVTIKPEKNLFQLPELLIRTGLASSKSEAKRLIEQGGVEIDNERITETNKEIAVEDSIIIRVGKRKYLEVKRD